MPKTRQAPISADEAAPSNEYMKSLRTGLRVLLEFESGPRDLGVTELANRCGLSKSQVAKILSALVDSGLVAQDPQTRTYHVGQRSYLLGSRFTTHDALCQAATPAMRELLNRTGHSVRLSIPHGDQSLYLIGLEGPYFIDTGWHSGNCVPMGASSAGRVMMAFMAPAEFVNALKTGTSRRLRTMFARELAGVYCKPVLWSRSYCVLSCGGAPLEIIKQYIQQQDRPGH